MYESAAVPLVMHWRVVSDEEALIQGARDDPAAFGTLYEHYRDRIYAYLRARSASDEDAADLTQQVFLHAFRALPQYHPQRGAFAPWLFRIARNAATDAHRRRKNTIAWDLMPEALQPIADDDPEAGLLHRETLYRLRVVLNTYPAATREILALRFAAALTIAEIAVVVGKSEAAVKKQLTRALRSLKEHYHEQA